MHAQVSGNTLKDPNFVSIIFHLLARHPREILKHFPPLSSVYCFQIILNLVACGWLLVCGNQRTHCAPPGIKCIMWQAKPATMSLSPPGTKGYGNGGLRLSCTLCGCRTLNEG